MSDGGTVMLQGPMRCIFIAFACLLPVLAFSQTTILTLGTATEGGGFRVYGAAFAEVVNAQDPSLFIETRDTAGSSENVPLLDAGKLDIALVQGEVANSVLARAANRLHIITAIYSSPGLFVVRGDSPDRTIADLKGRPVVLGAKGSGLPLLGRNVLEGAGLDPDRDIQPILLDRAADGPAMVLDGRAAALWGAGISWPAFTTVAKAGGRFIAPDASEIKRILARFPHLRAVTLAARSYPGQDTSVATVGSWSFVLAKPDLADDAAYRLARALHLAEARFAARLPQARETTTANTVAAAPRPDLIHPGVQRYLREAGLLH